jgi:hypothetical protein
MRPMLSKNPVSANNPNSEQVHELSYRPHTFVHPLYFHYDPAKKYTLSNGYLIELSYVEELEPLYNIELKRCGMAHRFTLRNTTAKNSQRRSGGIAFY